MVHPFFSAVTTYLENHSDLFDAPVNGRLYPTVLSSFLESQGPHVIDESTPLYRPENFQLSDLDSKDIPFSAALMRLSVVQTVDHLIGQIRERFSELQPSISSGLRSISHNRDVGGKTSSAHISGFAVDIDLRYIKTFSRVRELLELVFLCGFNRVGFYYSKKASFMHVDLHPTLPSYQIWGRTLCDKTILNQIATFVSDVKHLVHFDHQIHLS